MLGELLDKYKPLSPFYQNYKLANHLPMVLISLSKMGANHQRLEKYAKFYIDRYHLQTAVADVNMVAIDHKNWLNHLGCYSCYSSYLIFFKNEFSKFGKDDFLVHYLPQFINGFAVHAYHPLIRLALSVDAGDDNDIPYAFAYWAAGFWRLSDQKPNFDLGSHDDILSHIQSKAEFNKVQASGENIEIRLQKIVTQLDLKKLPVLNIHENSLKDIASVLAKLYFSTQNFTVLHGVTSCHALRTILPYFKSQQRQELAIRNYWLSLSVVYVMLGCPKYEDIPEISQLLPTWATLFQLACEHSDPHVIKLVYSCYEEYCHYGDQLYHAIAAQKLGLLQDF
ncbi:questin oxidase family protein [Piscirickettsia litoralis]|uniref:DUF4243 domain-containing protein n=1 Tax=Piscirickettsia litoralis TaxID=1891921 RepID=A0ABX3A2T2_9GAMM|nr:questin oxidase family protein [Piscirickettsia litoralis]ODN43172.1 hypothetical protein BGC07_09900 [Piscirickettsia litoralis]